MSEHDATRGQARGFQRLCDPDEAIGWIDAHVSALGSELVDVREAVGRVLARTVVSDFDVPDDCRAACDGYALSADTTVGAGSYNPLPFQLAIREGTGASNLPHARAVDCGASLPAGADAVLPRDAVDRSGSILEVTTPVAAGENVVPRAREVANGEPVLAGGRRLRPQDLAFLDLSGVTRIEVVRAPRARIVCMRDRQQDRISSALGALLRRDGCDRVDIEYAQGEPAAFASLLDAGEVDFIVGVGGTGLGDNDHAIDMLASRGEVLYHGIAIHPGESSALGRLGGCPVMLVPGTPLAAFLATDYFACRLARRLCGRGPDWPYAAHSGILTRKISSRLGRLEFCRVRVGEYGIEPIAVTDGFTLATAVRADGFLLIPVHSEGFAAGTRVTAHLYDEFCQTREELK